MPSSTKTKVALMLLLSLSLILLTFHVPLVYATEDSWTTKAPMFTARAGLGVAVVDGKVYAIGGYNGNTTYLQTNEMYDPVTDTWTTKASMPTPRAFFGIAVYQNKIHVIGGRVGSNYTYTGANEVYDPVTDTWETKTPLPTPRDGLDANVVNGKIYLIGGQRINLPGYSIQTFDLNEVYDPSSDAWTTKTPLLTPVYDYTSAVIDNKICVIGGSGGTLNQIYNPENDTWSNGTPSPYSTTYGAGAATTGNLAAKRIYIIGGGDIIPIDGNLIYDPEGDEWSAGTPMPQARNQLAVAVVDDVLYAIGGVQGAVGDVYAINHQYTPAGYIPEFPSWTILPLLLVATLVILICKQRLPKTSSSCWLFKPRMAASEARQRLALVGW
jgi:N-acetylneuraminic acid mutarotase